MIMTPTYNGLHAMSGETSQDAWHYPATATGGITPAVDQENGWVYYQSNGMVRKLDASTGAVLSSASVGTPHSSCAPCIIASGGDEVPWAMGDFNDDDRVAVKRFAFCHEPGPNGE